MITIIGAGFAGVEAANAAAAYGVSVRLFEMKPKKFSPAHKVSGFAELVCSNSFKASRINSAAGLLKAEMKRLGSLTVPIAEENAVPAGGALAVDRDCFSGAVTKKIRENPLIEVINNELADIPHGTVIIATGPLTSDGLADAITAKTGGMLSFFDAAAPIVTAESINPEKTFFGARYGKGTDDYINCPFERAEYELFWNELINAESAPLHAADKLRVYEGCMPIEVLAKRGIDSPRFGPMKPVGFTDPRTGKRPYALVQLRAENTAGSLYNIVGFQTNLKFGEQKRVFSMIPGLENAEFARYGVMHRNSFLNSPAVLNADFSMKNDPNVFFAGQITGVEGYMESAASGIIAGINAARLERGEPLFVPPEETMIGALCRYIAAENANFQPMGASMGLLPELPERIRDKSQKYQALADRAMAAYEKIA
ncbi:MAG: methylenetetrahydrofolate--tRNA-(uracil(54)-C(5))-methyltransferase (FADH(2)-oxidizing) TrmFO [Ruminococcus sp.]|jgi:methylenetetrahydrofolate--tRNA-(uracil-5-)-methyltransferase|nr:methylenetetrahydrofolate--tRNA-(uracil(54)-C(5))-methyltransferase (FADH(2)-oxidizing) TrmFO [Ruminococcus sp.]